MDELKEHVQKLRQHMPELVSLYRVKSMGVSMGVFGSYVRGHQRKGSDLDVLVEFHKAPSLFKFIALEHYLSDLLGVKVDLVMKDALKPAIGQHILSEIVSLRHTAVLTRKKLSMAKKRLDPGKQSFPLSS